jgi:CubicO group peptidase (beta-lactamase class C family)
MRLLVISACVSLSACAVPPAEGRPEAAAVSVLAARTSAADPLAGPISEFLAGPPASVLVRRGAAEGYASTEGVPRDRPFWIGSLTKPLTAAAVLKLEEQGKLSVTDPITRFFPDAPADKRAITLHHLLTHTSGLPHAYASEGVADRAAAVRTVLALPLIGAPGAAAKYSNDGYNLLAAVVEQASGMPYERYLQTQILQPAGMSNAGFWPGHAARIAVSRPPSARVASPNWGYRGATGVYASADDLLRFTSALREGRLLSPARAALAMGPRFERDLPAADIGYGWFLSERDGAPMITHSGAEDGLEHFGWIYVFPETDQTAVILVAGVPEDRAGQIRSGVLKRLSGPGASTAQRP